MLDDIGARRRVHPRGRRHELVALVELAGRVEVPGNRVAMQATALADPLRERLAARDPVDGAVLREHCGASLTRKLDEPDRARQDRDVVLLRDLPGYVERHR